MTCPPSLKMTSTESAILCFLRLRSTCEQHLHLHYTHVNKHNANANASANANALGKEWKKFHFLAFESGLMQMQTRGWERDLSTIFENDFN